MDNGVLDGIVANNVRQDNTAYELMQATLKLQKDRSLGSSAIARALGVSEGYVKDLIAVSGLPEPLHELLHVGTLGIPAAKALLRLKTPEEQVRVGFDFATNQMSGPRAESVLNTYLDIKRREADMPPEQALERAQAEPLFTCETCGHNKPIRGSQGKVLCADCWREMTYLWETEKRRHNERLVKDVLRETTPESATSWTVTQNTPIHNSETPEQHTAETPPPET